MTFFRTFLYWTTVHDSGNLKNISKCQIRKWLIFFSLLEYDSFDLINFLVHTVLAILMFADLLLVGHPVRMDPDLYFSGELRRWKEKNQCENLFFLIEFSFPFIAGTGLGYSIFTLVYFLAGGTDRKLQNNIYPLVNWEKPGKTIVVCVGGIFFVVFVHILCCCACKVRFLIHKKLFAKKEKNRIPGTCKEHAKMLHEQKDFTIPTILDLK